MNELAVLERKIVACTLCPRLRDHCREIARVKRRAYLDHDYWGKPVPSFGDPQGRVLILGLAPGAHGANRTGRMFTGDKSGEFLYRALHETGFASQPTGISRDDGNQFMPSYLKQGIFKQYPFEVLDQEGVGQLMKIAADRGHSTRPDLKVGICGEHGGEPESVKFCNRLHLDYVSCSPFRLLTARLAAAQGALEEQLASDVNVNLEGTR